MKRLITCLVLLAAVVCCHTSTAQVTDTRGTDFWVGFMSNSDTTQGLHTLSVFATSPRNCTATVSNPNTGWSTSFSVTPSGNHQALIPIAQAYHTNTASGTVLDKGIHVTSTDSIWLFAITEGTVDLDMDNIYPTEMLGSEYLVQDFPSDQYPTEFVVVAAEDHVTVDITPGCNTTNGWTAGNTYTVSLPAAGKSIQIQSVANGDLTNTRIVARNGRKIAVFNGDACVYIPTYTSCQSCDHAVEQAIPVQQWGTKFVARGSERYEKLDRVRITSLQNGCEVRRNGTLVHTLNAGESYTYELATNDAADFFQTSKPAVAYEYFPSLNDDQHPGDPSMTTLPPLEQGVTSAHFLSPSFTMNYLTTHKVIIVTSTSNVNNISLDNHNIGSEFLPVGTSGYSYVYRTVSAGHHYIHSSSDSTFVAYSFGFGTRVSYGYGVGLSARNLRRPGIYVNGHNEPSHVDVCQGDTVSFVVDTGLFSLHQVEWVNQVNNATYTSNPTFISFPDTGSYTVCAHLAYMSSDSSASYYYDTVCTIVHVFTTSPVDSTDTVCANTLPYSYLDHTFSSDTTYVFTDTTGICPHPVTFHLIVADTFDVHADTLVCQTSLPFIVNNDTLYADTTVSFTSSSVFNCDSSGTLQLHVINNDTVAYDTSVCQMSLPLQWHGVTFTGDGIKTVTSQGTNGCDSITFLNLHVILNDTASADTSYCSNHLPFVWYDMSLTEGGVYYHRVSVGESCDSVYKLTLSLRNCDCDDPAVIWAPNIFTPSRETNSEFKVFSTGIEEAKMVIYQRFGMYITELDALTQSWDGTKDGRPCKDDAYVYKIYYRTKCAPKELHIQTGTVLLVR